MTNAIIVTAGLAIAMLAAASTVGASPRSIVRAQQQAQVKARKAAMRAEAMEARRDVLRMRLRKMERLRALMRRNGEELSDVDESIQRLRRQEADLGD